MQGDDRAGVDAVTHARNDLVRRVDQVDDNRLRRISLVVDPDLQARRRVVAVRLGGAHGDRSTLDHIEPSGCHRSAADVGDLEAVVDRVARVVARKHEQIGPVGRESRGEIGHQVRALNHLVADSVERPASRVRARKALKEELLALRAVDLVDVGAEAGVEDPVDRGPQGWGRLVRAVEDLEIVGAGRAIVAAQEQLVGPRLSQRDRPPVITPVVVEDRVAEWVEKLNSLATGVAGGGIVVDLLSRRASKRINGLVARIGQGAVNGRVQGQRRDRVRSVEQAERVATRVVARTREDQAVSAAAQVEGAVGLVPVDVEDLVAERVEQPNVGVCPGSRRSRGCKRSARPLRR